VCSRVRRLRTSRPLSIRSLDARVEISAGGPVTLSPFGDRKRARRRRDARRPWLGPRMGQHRPGVGMNIPSPCARSIRIRCAGDGDGGGENGMAPSRRRCDADRCAPSLFERVTSRTAHGCLDASPPNHRHKGSGTGARYGRRSQVGRGERSPPLDESDLGQ
jgi:hypothetical protein